MYPLPFENNPVDLTGMPELDEGGFQPFDSRYRVAALIARSITGAVFSTAACAIPYFLPRWWAWLAPVAIALWSLASMVLFVLSFPTIGWQLRDYDLSHRTGFWSRNTTTTPLARVQNVSVHEGLINRRFGLGSVSIETASGSLDLPGLSAEDAYRLRNYLLSREPDAAVGFDAAAVE